MLKLVSPQSISTTIPEPLHQQYERLKNENWDAQKEWVEEWAEKGYAPAQFLLAKHYDNIEWNSISIAPVEFALKLEKDDEIMPIPPAADSLCLWVHRHYFDEGNYQEAVKLYQKTAIEGSAYAKNNLGVCYFNGYGVERSYEQAAKWFMEAAEQGKAVAQCNLGVCYYNGQGVDNDYQKAVEWFAKAAEQGKAAAQCNLGVCYYNGLGVDKDNKKAVEWYTKAAEQGNLLAQSNLAGLYFYGKGIIL